LALIIIGEKVEFSLTERLREVKEDLSDRERLSPLYYGQTFKLVYKPTGELTLKIHSVTGAGHPDRMARSTWETLGGEA
jgi:hypothetical protein